MAVGQGQGALTRSIPTGVDLSGTSDGAAPAQTLAGRLERVTEPAHCTGGHPDAYGAALCQRTSDVGGAGRSLN